MKHIIRAIVADLAGGGEAKPPSCPPAIWLRAWQRGTVVQCRVYGRKQALPDGKLFSAGHVTNGGHGVSWVVVGDARIEAFTGLDSHKPCVRGV